MNKNTARSIEKHVHFTFQYFNCNLCHPYLETKENNIRCSISCSFKNNKLAFRRQTNNLADADLDEKYSLHHIRCFSSNLLQLSKCTCHWKIFKLVKLFLYMNSYVLKREYLNVRPQDFVCWIQHTWRVSKLRISRNDWSWCEIHTNCNFYILPLHKWIS